MEPNWSWMAAVYHSITDLFIGHVSTLGAGFRKQFSENPARVRTGDQF